MTGLLDAFDSILWSETLLARLNAAAATLSAKQGLRAEKEWLRQATDRLSQARDGVGDVLSRSMRLPELEPLREDHARTLQQTAVDSIERLQAGIAFHVGTRAPILEGLFGKVKFAAVRRADKDDFERIVSDFEKKLGGSYCTRMFAEPQFAFAGPVVDEMRTAVAAWRAAFSAERLPVHEETAIRDELFAAARKLELPLRQARLLAEAALCPLKNAFDESGIANRPKRRGAKPAITDVSEASESKVDRDADEEAFIEAANVAAQLAALEAPRDEASQPPSPLPADEAPAKAPADSSQSKRKRKPQSKNEPAAVQ